MQDDTFTDLHHAGRSLARSLARWAGRDDTVVLAVPRAGVPIGFEVACALDAPLDVLVVHELYHGRAGNTVLGAVAAGGTRALARNVARFFGVSEPELERMVALEVDELSRVERAYRGDLPPRELEGRTAIVVDSGIASAWSMMAAVAALQRRDPAHIVFASPVGDAGVCHDLRLFCDEIVCARLPDPYWSTRYWYDDEHQPSDDEIRDLLHRRAPERRPSLAPWATRALRWAA